MDFMKEYNRKLMTADEAIDAFVRDGDHIQPGGHSAPEPLLRALMKAVKERRLRGIKVYGEWKYLDYGFGDPDLTKDMVQYFCTFYGAMERKYRAENDIVSFVPVSLSQQFRYNRDVVRADVGFVGVTPPDENGLCSVGPMVAGQRAIELPYCKKIIGVVNKNIPYVYGDRSTFVSVDQMDAIVEEDYEYVTMENPVPTETDEKIASYITELVPDGATLQLGVGGIPNAVGYGLQDHKDLGAFTEMFSQSMGYLQKKGVLNNSKKTFMPGISVAGFSLGNREHYDYLDHNKDVYFMPYTVTNFYEYITKNDNMISVNSAIMVDLAGQVAASSLPGRQYSGTGGHMDYAIGAAASKGGKSFIAFNSTVKKKDGSLASKIVLNIPPGVYVDTPRHSVQYVVTEYGCVDLFGEDIPTRAKKLISIAHPQFREQLEYDARKQGLIY